jgi:hypothetical protein
MGRRLEAPDAELPRRHRHGVLRAPAPGAFAALVAQQRVEIGVDLEQMQGDDVVDDEIDQMGQRGFSMFDGGPQRIGPAQKRGMRTLVFGEPWIAALASSASSSRKCCTRCASIESSAARHGSARERASIAAAMSALPRSNSSRWSASIAGTPHW